MSERKDLRDYWKKNLRYVSVLITIWFSVSYVCGILLADSLDKIKLGGFPLGFWFANQGSLVTFVVLIVVYVKLMNDLDHEFDVHEQ